MHIQPTSRYQRFDPNLKTPLNKVRATRSVVNSESVSQVVAKHMASPYQDRAGVSDEHRAIEYWVSKRLFSKKPPHKNKALFYVLEPVKDRYKARYDPKLWRPQAIHYTMTRMLYNSQYRQLHTRLAMYLIDVLRGGDTRVSSAIVTAINDRFKELKPYLRSRLSSHMDIFESFAKPVSWVEKIKDYMGLRPQEPKERLRALEDIQAYFRQHRVEEDKAIMELFMRSIDQIRERLLAILKAIIEPSIYLPTDVTDQLGELEEAMRRRYEELARSECVQRMMEDGFVEDILGLIPVQLDTKDANIDRDVEGLMYTQESPIDGMMLHDILYHLYPEKILTMNVWLTEKSVKDHTVTWHMEVTDKHDLLDEMTITYYSRLGIAVLVNALEEQEDAIHFSFDTFGRVTQFSGTIMGKPICFRNRLRAQHQGKPRMEIGDWKLHLDDDKHTHQEGYWETEDGTKQTRFDVDYRVFHNSQRDYVVNAVSRVGNRQMAVHYRYHPGLPLPLCAVGVIG